MSKRWFSAILAAGVMASMAANTLIAAPIEASKPAAKPFLGVAIGKPEKDAGKEGAWVNKVEVGSPADKAGLKDGDLITHVGKDAVKGPEELVKAIAACKPGSDVELKCWRDGKEHSFTVTLGERRVAKLPEMKELFGNVHRPYLGVMTEELTPELKKDLGVNIDKGVVVREIVEASPAAKAGLKTNDVITGVGEHAVVTHDDLRGAVEKAGAGTEITLKVLRGKEAMEIKARLGKTALGMNWHKDFDQLPLERMPKGLDSRIQKHLEEIRKLLQERALEPEQEQESR